MKSNKSKDNFLQTALELRYSDKIQSFRNWIAELESAYRSDIKEYSKMKENAQNILNKNIFKNEFRKSVEGVNLTIGTSGMSVANIPIGKWTSILTASLKNFLNRKNKPLLFLSDLGDLSFIARDEEIRHFLGRIDGNEIRRFRRITDYRSSKA